MKTVTYKGETFAHGTQAHKLFEERKFKELDAHLREVTTTYHRMRGDPVAAPTTKKEPNNG